MNNSQSIKPDFYNKIKSISSEESKTLELFLILKDKTIKRARLDNNTSENLLSNFLETLNYNINENTEYKPIDELDDTSKVNEYLYFRNSNIYEKVEYLIRGWENTNDIENINTLEKNIFGLLFKISSFDNYILLYQQSYSFSFIKKDKLKSLFVENGIFKELNKNILNIYYKIDFLIDKDFFIILNLKPLETQYGYIEVIKKDALSIIERISAINFIENLDIIKNNLDSTNAKKIRNADEHILKMFETEFDVVKNFVENHTELKKYLKFNQNGKIELKTKQDKKYFIKLLTNDYLHSLLTKDDFDSISKRRLNQ